MSNITETLKAKLDELDLDRRLDQLTGATEKAVKRGVERAGELAHDNREKVASFVDKAATTIDSKTEGKYADTVDKVRSQVVIGVDKLAAKRPVQDAAGTETEPAGTPQDTPAPSAQPGAPSPWGAHTDEV